MFEYILYFFVILFGVCIGSFLNCVIYRLETEKSLKGRSFCPHCKHVLSWQDLFPVFSFLFLGTKCRYCKKGISWQYPLVELATGVFFLLIFIFQFSFVGQLSALKFINLAFWFYIISVLIVIFIYDLKHYLIPDKVLFPAIVIALIYNFAAPQNILNNLLAVVISSGFFLTIFLISKGKWMGFGDVKFAILMGLLLGVQNVLVALFLAFFFGAIIGLALMVLEKKGLKSEIPFGPFLIIGTFIASIYGNLIVQWYLNFLKI